MNGGLRRQWNTQVWKDTLESSLTALREKGPSVTATSCLIPIAPPSGKEKPVQTGEISAVAGGRGM